MRDNKVKVHQNRDSCFRSNGFDPFNGLETSQYIKLSKCINIGRVLNYNKIGMTVLF